MRRRSYSERSGAEGFETAAQPKKLVIIPGGHFDGYRGQAGQLAKAAARDFFVEHLAVNRILESAKTAGVLAEPRAI